MHIHYIYGHVHMQLYIILCQTICYDYILYYIMLYYYIYIYILSKSANMSTYLSHVERVIMSKIYEPSHI